MKQRIVTNIYWYNELKDCVKCSNEYYFTEKPFCEKMVEYTVENIEEFNKISKEKGWI